MQIAANIKEMLEAEFSSSLTMLREADAASANIDAVNYFALMIKKAEEAAQSAL